MTRRRQSVRLQGYNYSWRGMYFVTICTFNRECLFGEIRNSVMILNHLGKMVRVEWLKTMDIRPYVRLHEYVIMPNHFHGLIEFVGATDRSPLQKPGPLKHSLGAVMAGFKSATTRTINDVRQAFSIPVWQRNYHDRIVRGDGNEIREYIRNNPKMWHADPENPKNRQN